jgi:hypothetical protein
MGIDQIAGEVPTALPALKYPDDDPPRFTGGGNSITQEERPLQLG